MTAPPPASPPSAFDLTGAASLWMVLQWVDVETAAALLPPELTLMPVAGAQGGQHPLLYSLGRQQNVKLAFAPFGGWNYDETLFGVCSVAVRSPAGPVGPFSYMTQLRLNSLVAMLIGRALGYPKDLSRIATSDTSYRIGTAFSNTTLLDAHCEAQGPAFDGTLGGFQMMGRFLADPVISRAITGSLLVSRFEIDPAGHVMRPAGVTISVPTTKIHGLAPGQYHWPPITAATPGGVQSTHQWRLARPRRFAGTTS